MYPGSPRKREVPTFSFNTEGRFWEFVQEDIEWLEENSTVYEPSALPEESAA